MFNSVRKPCNASVVSFALTGFFVSFVFLLSSTAKVITIHCLINAVCLPRIEPETVRFQASNDTYIDLLCYSAVALT